MQRAYHKVNNLDKFDYEKMRAANKIQAIKCLVRQFGGKGVMPGDVSPWGR